MPNSIGSEVSAPPPEDEAAWIAWFEGQSKTTVAEEAQAAIAQAERADPEAHGLEGAQSSEAQAAPVASDAPPAGETPRRAPRRRRAAAPREGAPPPAPRPRAPHELAGSANGARKPVIQVIANTIKAMTDASEQAVIKAKLPIYQRYGELVRVRPGDDGGKLMVDTIPEPQLFESLSIAAHWEKWDKRANDFLPCNPSRDAVQVLATRGSWELPHLHAIYDAPILRPDGTVLQTPGYDVATKSIYRPSCVFPPVREHPTKDHAHKALAFLKEPFVGHGRDFPYVADSDLSTILACLLTVMSKHAINDATPIFAVRATDRGVGKSRLLDVVSMIALGEVASRTSFKNDPDEETKTFLSWGMKSAPMIMLDNVDKPLGGDILAMVSTAKTFEARALSFNRMVKVPVPVITATGVNMVVKDDLGRRVIPCDMDAKIENPHRRTGFKYPDLMAWLELNRPKLAVAALTILRAYESAGRPHTQAVPYGSYEKWAALVRQALLWLDQADPLDSQDRVAREGDVDRDGIAALYEAWYGKYGTNGATISDAIDAARYDLALQEALMGLDPKLNPDRMDARRISVVFRRITGRIIGRHRLEKGEHVKRGTEWKINLVTSQAPLFGVVMGKGDEGDEGDFGFVGVSSPLEPKETLVVTRTGDEVTSTSTFAGESVQVMMDDARDGAHDDVRDARDDTSMMGGRKSPSPSLQPQVTPDAASSEVVTRPDEWHPGALVTRHLSSVTKDLRNGYVGDESSKAGYVAEPSQEESSDDAEWQNGRE